MKRIFTYTYLLLFLITNLSGCNFIGNKNSNLSLIYFISAMLSLLLLIGCCLFVKQKKRWFVLLFSSVLVVNIGYTFLSVSSCLGMALQANRIAYLGSVFLPLAMLMNILNVINIKYSKWVPITLFCIAAIIFLITASPGVLDIYYKDVSFEVINGVSTLIKVYGPLHPLYLFYLLGYFTAMVTIIIRASIKKTIESTTHAVILASAVFVNIGVWFIEQIVSIEFEVLSISYIISELFLLGVHLVVNENQRLREIVKQVEIAQTFSESDKNSTNTMLENPLSTVEIDSSRFEIFVNGINQLTPTEQAIYNAYIARVTTKEIMANLQIKENTLKYHNRNIYGKLGVSSRKELLEVYKQIKIVNTNTVK